MLGLSVTVRMARVGGTTGDADREEGEERRDEVGARVRSLGEQAEAVGGNPGRELDRDQRAGRKHGDECCSPLGVTR